MVLCEWVDSCEPANNADLELEDIPEPQVIMSLGWMVRDEPSFVAIVGAVKVDDHAGMTYDYSSSIPRVSIMRVFDVQPEPTS
jgi:hypothetical protein